MSKWRDCPDYQTCKVCAEGEDKLECSICPTFYKMLAKLNRS